MADKPARILLISEPDGDQDALVDALNRCETAFDLHCVSSVSDAFDLPDVMTFDLILLDDHVYDDSLRHIVDLHPHAPVILLAELENRQTALDAIHRNACDLIIKDPEGYHLQVLPFKIRNLLAMHNARIKAEEEHARLMEMLEEKNAELQSIIHVASHDFRTPLITIAGFSGELTRSCRQLQTLMDEENDDFKASSRPIISEDIPEAVELIKASISKLASLLDGMQRLARLDHSALQKDTLDMNAMIGDIIKTIGFQAKEAGARFNVEPLPDCSGDEHQINQVFSNLLANAINYLDPARPGIITVTGRLAEGNLVYCVEDNGIGIEKHNLADIFKMYYLIDPEKSQGEGLGLAIVRRIVNRHNGKVWAESQPGKGSRFYVTLPVS